MPEESSKDIDTRCKIMDTAEKLFAEKGFDATSIRSIVAEAEVNLAAIHYHFGGKDELLHAVFKRVVETVNNERLLRLNDLEKNSATPKVEEIIRAFLLPLLACWRHEPHRIQHLTRLFGQMQSDPERFSTIIKDFFAEVGLRFINALAKALPELSKPELFWRFKFMLGAMHMMVANGLVPKKLGLFLKEEPELEAVTNSLFQFVCGGFQAQPTDKEKLSK